MPFSGDLLGHPDVDVWNHAWGYWYWLDSLSHGAAPWFTPMLKGPDGGVLYFVDPLGALAALPFSAIFGVSFAYNLVQLTRFVFAGLMSHLLCREVTGTGPHCWAAGVAYASSPYLLAEQSNGISEVGAVGWIPLCLWMAVRAFRDNQRKDWILLGLAQGMCSIASFYYGLTTALLIGGWWVCSFSKERLKYSFLAGGIAFALAAPFFFLFRASLYPNHEQGIIRRSPDLNTNLMEHNAVDPREYIMPGDFQSVDFWGLHGERFIHTGYLRLTVICLAIWVIWRVGRKTRPWIWMALGSLVLGLGPVLWWAEDFVRLGNNVVLLPFGWIQKAIPQLAITHPSRLSIGAQAIAALFVGWALVGRSRRVIALCSALLVLETLFLSSVRWPMPTSSTSVPELYFEIRDTEDKRGVLDLPAEVGTTMASSRYFWYQTVHEKTVPYGPDVRAGSSSDAKTFRWLQHATGPVRDRTPATVDWSVNRDEIRSNIEARYGWVVFHADFAKRAGVDPLFREALIELLGPPAERGSLLYWRL